MTERYLEDFTVGQTFGSGRLFILGSDTISVCVLDIHGGTRAKRRSCES
jgi:hypothetical protein